MDKKKSTPPASETPIRPKTLDRFRPTFFLVGLALSLFIVLAAFEWQTPRPTLEDNRSMIWEDELAQEVIRTATPKPTPPPPPPTPLPSHIVPVEEQVVFEIPSQERQPIEIALDQKMEVLPAPPVLETEAELPPKPMLPPEPEIEAPLIMAEQMPVFGDCNPSLLSSEELRKCSNQSIIRYLAKQIEYPEIAKEIGVEGTVVIRFVVEKDGSITGEEIVRDIGGGCGKEALRVLSNMPRWKPGKQRGRAVRVFFTLPVKYNLK